MISTLYQITLSLFQPVVPSLDVSWQRFLTTDIPMLTSFINGGSVPIELFLSLYIAFVYEPSYYI